MVATLRSCKVRRPSDAADRAARAGVGVADDAEHVAAEVGSVVYDLDRLHAHGVTHG